MIDNLLLSRAKAAVLARDFQLATRLYKNLLKENPTDVSLLSQLGNMYVKSGNDEKALPIFNQILSLDSDNLVAMNNLGAIYRRKKEYDSSVEILQKARSVHGDNSQVEYNLGFTYKIMGESEKAIQCFEDVIEENPSDVLAYNHIGSIYAERKRHEEAVQSYLRGLKIDPNHPVLHLNLAKSYEKLKKYDEALFEYENALRTKPGWIEAIDGYADLLMKGRKAKDASAIVMQAIRLNPEDAKMHSKLGGILSKQGDLESSIDEYSQALKIKDDYAPALSGLASSYEKQGNFSAAIQTMEKLESVKPNNAEVLQQYSGILLSADKTDEAKEKLDTLIEMAEDDPHTLNLLGQYHICTGNFDNAKKCFDKIEELYPAFKEYLKDGAKRMKQQGIFDEAETLQKQYLALHPEDPDSLSFLANLYEEQNKVSEALEFYKRSLNVFGDNIEYAKSVERLQQQLKSEEAPIYDTTADIDRETSSIAALQNENAVSDDEADDKEENEEAVDDTNSSIENIEDVAESDEENQEAESEEENEAKSDDDDIFSMDFGESESTDDLFASTATTDNITPPEPHNTEDDISKSIDKVVPLDEITDFDFSGMHHDLTPDETLAWSLHESEPVGKKFDKTIGVFHINQQLPNNATKRVPDIDSAWDNSEVQPKEKFDYFNDFNDISADDFSEAVDMTPQTDSEETAQTDSSEPTKELDLAELEKEALPLFEKIHDMTSFLPEEKKEQFFESKPRILLDYVLSKLHNEDGLFTLAQKQRTKLGIKDDTNETAINRESVKNTLQCLMSLSESLSDKSLCVALENEGEKLIAKL